MRMQESLFIDKKRTKMLVASHCIYRQVQTPYVQTGSTVHICSCIYSRYLCCGVISVVAAVLSLVQVISRKGRFFSHVGDTGMANQATHSSWTGRSTRRYWTCPDTLWKRASCCSMAQERRNDSHQLHDHDCGIQLNVHMYRVGKNPDAFACR